MWLAGAKVVDLQPNVPRLCSPPYRVMWAAPSLSPRPSRLRALRAAALCVASSSRRASLPASKHAAHSHHDDEDGECGHASADDRKQHMIVGQGRAACVVCGPLGDIYLRQCLMRRGCWRQWRRRGGGR